jgi:hypothetical protein
LKGITLDAGALIALERGDERAIALLDRVTSIPEAVVHVPAGALAQTFRDGPRQALLMRLLKKRQTHIVALDGQTACVAGMLLGLRGASDVIDASVVVCARRYRQPVLTTDPKDLRRLDSKLMLEAL